jgi:hypothetical protein
MEAASIAAVSASASHRSVVNHFGVAASRALANTGDRG